MYIYVKLPILIIYGNTSSTMTHIIHEQFAYLCRNIILTGS